MTLTITTALPIQSLTILYHCFLPSNSLLILIIFSGQDTIEDDVAARRVRDMVAQSQESALSEVRHSADHLY